MSQTVHHGDCLDVLASMPAASVDSVVTDPPYHLTSIVKRFGAENAAPAKTGATGVYAQSSRGFMGKQWDGGDIAFRPETWAAVLRVLKPGGHLVAFGAPRNYHRLACAIEDAGFEVRDSLMWLFGTGFNKVGMLKNRYSEQWCQCNGEQTTEYDLRSVRDANLQATEPDGEAEDILLDGVSEQDIQGGWAARVEPEDGGREQPGLAWGAVSGAGQGLCDAAEPVASEGAAERIRVRAHRGGGGDARSAVEGRRGSPPHQSGPSRQSTREPEGVRLASGTLDGGALRDGGKCPRCGGISRAFDGFGGSLKPAYEPIVLARKPLIGTVAANVLAHGTGALNIDGCRVGTEARPLIQSDRRLDHNTYSPGLGGSKAVGETSLGRWPANIVHDGSDEVLAGFPDAGGGFGTRGGGGSVYADNPSFRGNMQKVGFGDSGSAARFFYSAKASAKERAGSKHPTVKPISLMRWLCRLITPPGGTILDPFAGTGTTGQAAIEEGFSAILIEREAEYVEDIKRRISQAREDDLFSSEAAE